MSSDTDLRWLRIKARVLLEPVFALPLDPVTMASIRELPLMLEVSDTLEISFGGPAHNAMAVALEFGTTKLPSLQFISRLSRMLAEDLDDKLKRIGLV